jgi:hypothetical protein
MKFTLSKNHHEEITALRTQLAAALAETISTTGESDRLAKKQEKLQDEIATLEAESSESESAAAALNTKRSQLEQVISKIKKLANVPSTATDLEHGKLSFLLKQFARTAAAATGPVVENYMRQIAGKIRDYCQSDEIAFRLTYQIPAVASLVSTYTRPFGQFSVSPLEIKQAIARADEILSGELAWSFDAKK